MKKLATNIRDYKERKTHHGIPKSKGGTCCAESVAMLQGTALSITTGGAQDANHYKQIVNNGRVPGPTDFTMEGFLKDFDLSLKDMNSDDYLSVQPASAYNPNTKKLYVQLNVSTNVTKESFKRKPLNLTVVLDISGSMNIDDDTGKSRLEWAKQMIDQIADQLNQDDRLSLVIFDEEIETLIDGHSAPFNANIKATYADLKPRGSTDMYAGLKRGFELASKHRAKNVENRVILISDAGANTGFTGPEAFATLAGDYTHEGIGLTAIGIGMNFNEELVHQISMSQGGNYLFVQSGQELISFAEEFDFLVTPVAFNFKARLDLSDKNLKLVKTYGIPMKDGEPLGDVIDVRTLFFTGKGGGAMVLEFDVTAADQ